MFLNMLERKYPGLIISYMCATLEKGTFQLIFFKLTLRTRLQLRNIILFWNYLDFQ